MRASAASAQHNLKTPAAPASNSIDQYLGEIGRCSLLTENEELDVARRARGGDASAERELIARNLRFVVSIAKRYQHRGLSLDDLIGEGNVGLVAAAHRFDPDQGVRFITYAVWWVRQAILLALTRQVRVVRVPPNRPDLRFVQVSLDTTTSEAADRTLGEQLAAEPAEDFPEESEEFATLVASALASLQPREAHIVRKYFGLQGHDGQTLDEIAAEMRITRERVRQIRDRAIGKLRYGSHAAALFALAR